MDQSATAALAAAIGLPVPKDRLSGVAETLAVTMAMAARVMAAPLPAQTLENAPVFDAWGGDGNDR